MSSHQIYDIHLKLNLILRVCYDLFTPAVDSGTFFNYVPPRGLKQTIFFLIFAAILCDQRFRFNDSIVDNVRVRGIKAKKISRVWYGNRFK